MKTHNTSSLFSLFLLCITSSSSLLLTLPEEQDANETKEQVLKIREKLYLFGRAKFFQDVEMKDELHVEGALNTNSLISDCDVTVGCNINMNNSTSSEVGNILKDGERFIHNTGLANTFVGYDAGSFDVTGYGNSAFGTDALYNVSTGMGNSGMGFSTLVNNTSGNGNTATGVEALAANTVGNNNTANGSYALTGNITGSGNTALGAGAGSLLVSGDNNIYIAHNGVGSESGIIRIGTSATHTAAFMQGIFGSTIGGSGLAVEVDSAGQLGTIVSSKRFKKNINDMNSESSALYALRPVTFSYTTDENELKQFGLIAEEVAQAFPELVIFDQDNQAYAVKYQVLPVLLLNEVQNQYAMIQALAKRLEALEARA
jgi:hypothetical protein